MNRMPTDQHLDDLMNKNWEKMHQILEQELPQKKKKKRAIVWWLSAACIVASASYVILNWMPIAPQEETNERTTQQQTTTSLVKSELSTILNKDNPLESNPSSIRKTKSIPSKSIMKSKNTISNTLPYTQKCETIANVSETVEQLPSPKAISEVQQLSVPILDEFPIEENAITPIFTSKSKLPKRCFEAEIGYNHALVAKAGGIQAGLLHQIPFSNKIGFNYGLTVAAQKTSAIPTLFNFNDILYDKGASADPTDLSYTKISFYRIKMPIGIYWNVFHNCRVNTAIAGLYDVTYLTDKVFQLDLNSNTAERRPVSSINSYSALSADWNLQYYFTSNWSFKMGGSHQFAALTNKSFYQFNKNRHHEICLAVGYRF